MAAFEINDDDVIYYFRDRNSSLVAAWTNVFDEYKDTVKASYGDIFLGAPAADAIVSPANSFGFMDGGIDAAYTRFFGSQMQHRLQKTIREDYDGELLVGQAIVLPTYGPEGRDTSRESKEKSLCNEGQSIKFLISAPTMRIPEDVSQSVNVYLAFRAVILAVRKHNRTEGCEPIKSVLVPGLGTCTGQVPVLRCAWQMLQAYETFVKDLHDERRTPGSISKVFVDQDKLCEEEKYVAPPSYEDIYKAENQSTEMKSV